MSFGPLKSLAIEFLRGSTMPFTVSFEKGKKLTIVYGENGTGKSTICDALEFLGQGKVGSLENRGLGKTSRYWQSVGKKSADVAVTLENLDSSSCRATIVKGEVSASPAETRPHVEVLRRSHILTLLMAKPGERYSAISRFIDVSGVESSEATLRELIRDLNVSREVAVARIQENQDSVLQFWEAAAKPGADALAWAATEATRDSNSWDAEIDALDTLQASYARLAEYPAQLQSIEAAATTAEKAAAEAEQDVLNAVKTIAADAGEMMALLESAHSYLAKYPSPATCPLCESSANIDQLGERIAGRLEVFAVLQSARRKATAARKEFETVKQRLAILRADTKKHAEAFQALRDEFAWSADITLPSTEAPYEIEALKTWASETADLPVEWKKAETERHDRKQFTEALRLALRTYTENVRTEKDLDALLPRLTNVLEIVVDERRLFTDNILAKIASEVGRVYELVHPGEGLEKISLVLDPKKRASLEIGADFFSETDAPPQAYFSDSHLDTLGLCVFLTLAALDRPEDTILVLDDVLASVDEPHVERLIEMLYLEAVKFRHCVITTHYGPWKQKLRWGWLKNGQCQFIELSKWTNAEGMTLIRSIPDVERLRALLAEKPPDPQLICAKAGVILEAALDFLTLLYECSIPRKPGGLYTLGDLLPSIDRKLRNALLVEVLVTNPDGTSSYQARSLTPILDELTRIGQARNVFGCHFSKLSFDLLDSDGLGFGLRVLELIDTLADPEAGWPRNPKSGKYWANSGETRRLYPLKQPL
jgi:hypothetical protein